MRRTLTQQIARNRNMSLVFCGLIVLLLSAMGAPIAALIDPNAWLVGAAGAAALGLIVAVVAWKRGPSIVLRVSQARPASALDLQRLNNVAEEMALAAGIPTPHVFMIDDATPNAFATGWGPRQGMVVLTTGLVDQLDRDELQGVMAHEIAHIRNNDVKLLTTLAIVAGLIPLLADVYWRMLRFGVRGTRDKPSSATLIFLAVGVVLAILAPIFAKLLELAVSRQREYLADATAAELTRYPEGLARALEKISHNTQRLNVANRATEHMYIVNPFRPCEDRGFAPFSTHPPIHERIRRLRALMGHPSNESGVTAGAE